MSPAPLTGPNQRSEGCRPRSLAVSISVIAMAQCRAPPSEPGSFPQVSALPRLDDQSQLDGSVWQDPAIIGSVDHAGMVRRAPVSLRCCLD
jgi:hypothetical protein